MTLHTIAKSPYNNPALHSCLRSCAPDDVILLIEEGVYAAVADSDYSNHLLNHCQRIYALSADLSARGLSDQIAQRITPASDEKFVRLSLECGNVVNWY